jgi:hypothetical protein
VREATGVAEAVAALPQGAQLRLVRRTTATRAQHSGGRPIDRWIPDLAVGEFAIARARRGVGFRLSRGGPEEVDGSVGRAGKGERVHIPPSRRALGPAGTRALLYVLSSDRRLTAGDPMGENFLPLLIGFFIRSLFFR